MYKRQEVTVDAEGIKDGDYAGMCALQGCYGMAAVTKRDGRMLLVMSCLLYTSDLIDELEKVFAEIEEEKNDGKKS